MSFIRAQADRESCSSNYFVLNLLIRLYRILAFTLTPVQRKPLAQYNIDKVKDTAAQILDLCREPISFEILLQRLFESYDMAMDFSQYVLVGSTVRSYLSWLKDCGQLTVDFSTRLPLWQRT